MPLKDLISGQETTPEVLANLNRLFATLKIIEEKYGKSLTITSGYRSIKKHLEIYAKKGITDQTKIPMKSKHLFGLAADIYDPNGLFNIWCKKNEKWLESIGVFLENRQGPWQHIQIEKFASYHPGNIWFNP